jgi:hypothetical protein
MTEVQTKKVFDFLDDGNGKIGIPGVLLVDLGHQLDGRLEKYCW